MMMMMMTPLRSLIILLMGSVLVHGLVITRTGYGTHFEHIGRVIHASTVTKYHYTILYQYPNLTLHEFPPIDCTGFTARFGDKMCAKIVKYLIRSQQIYYEHLATAKHTFDVMIKKYRLKTSLAQLSTIEYTTFAPRAFHHDADKNTDDEEAETLPSVPLDFIPEAPINTASQSYELPAFVHTSAAGQILNTVQDFIPITLVGSVLSSVCGIPGRDDMNKFVHNVDLMGQAAYLSGKQVINVARLAASVLSIQNNKIDELVREGQLVNTQLNNAIRELNRHAHQFRRNWNLFKHRVLFSTYMRSFYHTYFLPVLLNATNIDAIQTHSVYDLVVGLINLHGGRMPGYTVITHDLMAEILRNITAVLNTNAVYQHLNLPSLDPAYYMDIEGLTTYAITDTHLAITLNIPLLPDLYDLYALSVFPVPINSGMAGIKPTTTTTETVYSAGYTKIENLPDYLAVSHDLQHYFEMSYADRILCVGRNSGREICGSHLPLPKNANLETTKKCSMNVFMDDHHGVKTMCTKSITEIPPPGTIKSIYGDNSYLIYDDVSDPNNEELQWTVHCPLTSNLITHVNSCGFCRLIPPEHCYLIKKHFIIPPTFIHPLSNDIGSSLIPTSIYTRNTMALSTILPEEIMNTVKSYEQLLNKHFPRIKYPHINFALTNDTFLQYLSQEKIDAGDYTKAIQLLEQNQSIYRHDIDQAYDLATNFSDVRTGHTTGVLKIAGDIFSGIFGANVLKYLLFIISPVFINTIALLILYIMLLPRFLFKFFKWVGYLISRCKNHTADDDDDDDDDDESSRSSSSSSSRSYFRRLINCCHKDKEHYATVSYTNLPNNSTTPLIIYHS